MTDLVVVGRAGLTRAGSGHYVKMVHNGIEYGDMQLIAEAYDILKRGLGLNEKEIADIFEKVSSDFIPKLSKRNRYSPRMTSLHVLTCPSGTTVFSTLS